MLTDQQCRAAVCPDGRKRIKLMDSGERGAGGLYLSVGPQSRVFRFDYMRHGKRRTLTLGAYPSEYSLSSARAEVRGYRARMRSDPTYDPSLERAAIRAAAIEAQQPVDVGETFREAAEHYFVHRSDWQQMPDDLRKLWQAGQPLPSGTRHPHTTEHRARDRVKRHLFPALGHVPMQELTPQLLASVVDRVGASDERGRVRGLLCGIVRLWHQKNQHLPDPLYALPAYTTGKTHIRRNFPSIVEPARFGLMVRDVRLVSGYANLNPLGCYFMTQVYLWQRPGALAQMRWSEVDFNREIWLCPLTILKISTEMKRRAELDIRDGLEEGYYKIPLPKQVIGLLEKLNQFKNSEYVFANSRGNPFSDGAMRQAFSRAGYLGRQTMHGVRATAKTVLEGFFEIPDRLVVEAQLGHGLDRYGTAYQRGAFILKRKRLTQGWADLVDWLADGKSIRDFRSEFLVSTPGLSELSDAELVDVT
ncbi:hypothetical protein EBQ24_10260 [Allofranklinella schreckenbergeri]|uniref:Integrase n=1 Tax=Allofranklinella schreckenbergeri TaxID=1076744 RepID=A0A3M6QVL0_9BURK|nr:integrase arm-type DNA-binding domain-containing protein [Allofranklinella schreckenbergeri]RMX07046.1 hypothetical protein EBQ24_10260 [Allofranklinella schreckenbergeri]